METTTPEKVKGDLFFVTNTARSGTLTTAPETYLDSGTLLSRRSGGVHFYGDDKGEDYARDTVMTKDNDSKMTTIFQTKMELKYQELGC